MSGLAWQWSHEKTKEANTMEREYKTGQHIVYVDCHGKSRDAIVTIWHMQPNHFKIHGTHPCLNLVIVTDDTTKTDCYGAQIERYTSVAHVDNMKGCRGNYWQWAD